jgi:copper homeostasis protein
MKHKPILEVCAFHIDSCLIAEKEGAFRVELCDNPIEGGTTPSYGTIKQVRDRISIQLFPILRPRSGNYYYSAEEFEILKSDIQMCKELHCDGISVGVQTVHGQIDKDRLSRIMDWAGPMGVTVNRVFDCAPEPFQALEDIIECGCQRILTSGQKAAAPDAADLLARLVREASGRISIMPGAGINATNIAALRHTSRAYEFHASARKILPNPLTYVNKEVKDYGHVYVADAVEVRAMVEALQNV